MSAKNVVQSCILVILANGFDEQRTIALLSILRQAGLCVKSVGLVSGLVGGAHGVRFMPDLTLADLDNPKKTKSVSIVVLPENEQSLARLGSDPRLHQFLRRVIKQKGKIAVGPKGMQFLKAAPWRNLGVADDNPDHIPFLLIQEFDQSPEAVAHDLVHRLV